MAWLQTNLYIRKYMKKPNNMAMSPNAETQVSGSF